MKIKTLSLRDFCGYPKLDLEFGEFTCLVGPNGAGKTTILNAVTLLCGSLDFGCGADGDLPFGTNKSIADERVKQLLRKNIRNVDEVDQAPGFRASAVFSHAGKDYEVVLTENGFEKNELVKQDFWWAGICYPTKFDCDMTKFQLRSGLWPKFKDAWDEITGYPACDPEIYTVTKLKKIDNDADYIIGFKMEKPGGKVHCRKGSAGEKKIMKSLTSIVNLEDERQPDIVLVDNVEMHVATSRHLKMLSQLQKLFVGKQIIATTHSVPIIESYEPKKDIVDIAKCMK